MNTEEKIKNNCIDTIIKTCKFYFPVVKESVKLNSSEKLIDVIVLSIKPGNSMLISESGIIAYGIKTDNGFKTKPLKLSSISMEEIYNCLAQIINRTISKT